MSQPPLISKVESEWKDLIALYPEYPSISCNMILMNWLHLSCILLYVHLCNTENHIYILYFYCLNKNNEVMIVGLISV